MDISYNNSGSSIEPVNEYSIAAATAVKYGQVVKLAAGLVVLATAGETGAILGVAAEDHGGAADVLNPRANGTRIKVFDSPGAVMQCAAPKATATGGSTTTFVCSGLNSFADDDFNGGVIKLVSKAAASLLVDPIGTEYPVTDFTNATGTFTIAAITGGFVAGDICEVYPPSGFAKGNLDAGISKLILTASAALPIRVNNRDTNRHLLMLEPVLHQRGSKAS